MVPFLSCPPYLGTKAGAVFRFTRALFNLAVLVIRARFARIIHVLPISYGVHESRKLNLFAICLLSNVLMNLTT